MKYGISREEEAALPTFKSHDEARAYFKEAYGQDFMMIDSDDFNGGKTYFYKLILNRKAYEEAMEFMKRGERMPMTEEYVFATQDISIDENGHVHIVH